MASISFRNPQKASEYCLVCSNNSKKNSEYSYFRFPKDEKRCNEWKLKLQQGRLDSFTSEQCYKRFRVCSKHFESRMFSSIQKNRLKRDAVPTIFEDEGHSVLELEASSVASMKTLSELELHHSISLVKPKSESQDELDIEILTHEIKYEVAPFVNNNDEKVNLALRKAKLQNELLKLSKILENATPAEVDIIENCLLPLKQTLDTVKQY